jgi:hypothetical protein
MGELLSAMISVLFAWSGLCLIFIGLGLFIRRSFGLTIRGAGSVLTAFWIGWAFAILFLQLWHFYFKVDWRVLVPLTAGSTAGLLWNWHDLWHTITKRFPQKCAFCFVLLLMALWLANHAIGPPLNYDSGLYHFTSMRWAASYPIVPGLGNLHYRIAFNSSYFLYVAMLDIGPWAQKSHHLANGLLLLVLLTQILSSGFKLVNGSEQVYHLFDIMLLAPVLKEAWGANIASPSPDLPVFVLGVVVSRQLLVLLANSQYSRREIGYAVFFITVLASIGVTVKLSFIALGCAASLLALVVWFARSGREGRTDDRRTLSWVTTCVALLLVSWMIRGIILSGYIAYPNVMGSFPVEWRIPRSYVAATTETIQVWARQPGSQDPKVLFDWGWLVPWAYRLPTFDAVIPLLLTLAGCFCTLFYHVMKYRESKASAVLWLFLLPSVASLLFWFMTAPDPRYAGAPFWVLGAGTVALAAQNLGMSFNRKMTRFVIFLGLISGLIVHEAISGKAGALRIILLENNPLKAFRQLSINRDATIIKMANPVEVFRAFVINKPGKDSGFYPPPHVELNTFVTRSGLIIYVPKNGKECWDAPLPCARRPMPDLRLRQEGDMSRGFMCSDPEENLNPEFARCGL